MNGYPILDSIGDSLKWLLLFAPVTMVGVIPARFLLRPDASTFAAEATGATSIFFFGAWMFRRGLRRYQSTPMFTNSKS